MRVMNYEAIRSLAGAEAEAKELLKDAAAKAKEIIELAKAQGDEEKAALLRKAEDSNARALEDALTRARQEASAMEDDDRLKAIALKELASPEIPAAVKLIMERIEAE